MKTQMLLSLACSMSLLGAVTLPAIAQPVPPQRTVPPQPQTVSQDLTIPQDTAIKQC